MNDDAGCWRTNAKRCVMGRERVSDVYSRLLLLLFHFAWHVARAHPVCGYGVNREQKAAWSTDNVLPSCLLSTQHRRRCMIFFVHFYLWSNCSSRVQRHTARAMMILGICVCCTVSSESNRKITVRPHSTQDVCIDIFSRICHYATISIHTHRTSHTQTVFYMYCFSSSFSFAPFRLIVFSYFRHYLWDIVCTDVFARVSSHYSWRMPYSRVQVNASKMSSNTNFLGELCIHRNILLSRSMFIHDRELRRKNGEFYANAQ